MKETSVSDSEALSLHLWELLNTGWLLLGQRHTWNIVDSPNIDYITKTMISFPPSQHHPLVCKIPKEAPMINKRQRSLLIKCTQIISWIQRFWWKRPVDEQEPKTDPQDVWLCHDSIPVPNQTLCGSLLLSAPVLLNPWMGTFRPIYSHSTQLYGFLSFWLCLEGLILL